MIVESRDRKVLGERTVSLDPRAALDSEESLDLTDSLVALDLR